MRRIMSIGAGLVAVFVGLVVAAGPASAGGQIVTLNCGSGPVPVSTNGNGQWTPGRVTTSTQVLHATSFGAFTGTFTPNNGQPPFPVNDPPVSRKTVPANGRPLVTCTFHIEFTDENGSFSGDGSVTGWATGKK